MRPSETYWQSLEAGIRATYAQMAGVPDAWTATSAGISAGAIDIHTLNAAPHVSVVFLRLPDGMTGNGSPAYGQQSLAKLWRGQISTITTVDGRDWYTRAEMRNILHQLMSDFGATTVRTQDWTSNPDALDDHTDHWATAMFTQLASRQYAAPHTLLAYEAYVIETLPQNVTGDDLSRSVSALVTFAGFDKFLCDTPGAGCPDPPHDAWLKRQYLVAVESTRNAARESGATASASSRLSTAQDEGKAKDGFAVGAPIDPAREWVSDNQKTGAWIQYSFAAATPIDGVTLFDRPNLDDQITAANLVFSDGSSLALGPLPNNGAGLTVTFPVRTVTAVRLDVTAVSATTTAIGLAEFEAWRGTGGAPAPEVSRNPSHDFDGDGNADVLGRDSSGNLRLYPGDGSGGGRRLGPSGPAGTG